MIYSRCLLGGSGVTNEYRNIGDHLFLSLMIIHCTKKLAAKLPAVAKEPQTETSPLAVNRWLCHSPVSRGKAFWMPDEAMMERVARL